MIKFLFFSILRSRAKRDNAYIMRQSDWRHLVTVFFSFIILEWAAVSHPSAPFDKIVCVGESWLRRIIEEFYFIFSRIEFKHQLTTKTLCFAVTIFLYTHVSIYVCKRFPPFLFRQCTVCVFINRETTVKNNHWDYYHVVKCYSNWNHKSITIEDKHM